MIVLITYNLHWLVLFCFVLFLLQYLESLKVDIKVFLLKIFTINYFLRFILQELLSKNIKDY